MRCREHSFQPHCQSHFRDRNRFETCFNLPNLLSVLPDWISSEVLIFVTHQFLIFIWQWNLTQICWGRFSASFGIQLRVGQTGRPRNGQKRKEDSNNWSHLQKRFFQTELSADYWNFFLFDYLVCDKRWGIKYARLSQVRMLSLENSFAKGWHKTVWPSYGAVAFNIW